jgi:hypothetical protein
MFSATVAVSARPSTSASAAAPAPAPTSPPDLSWRPAIVRFRDAPCIQVDRALHSSNLCLMNCIVDVLRVRPGSDAFRFVEDVIHTMRGPTCAQLEDEPVRDILPCLPGARGLTIFTRDRHSGGLSLPDDTCLATRVYHRVWDPRSSAGAVVQLLWSGSHTQSYVGGHYQVVKSAVYATEDDYPTAVGRAVTLAAGAAAGEAAMMRCFKEQHELAVAELNQIAGDALLARRYKERTDVAHVAHVAHVPRLARCDARRRV